LLGGSKIDWVCWLFGKFGGFTELFQNQLGLLDPKTSNSQEAFQKAK
jgi:hypothetical protein